MAQRYDFRKITEWTMSELKYTLNMIFIEMYECESSEKATYFYKIGKITYEIHRRNNESIEKS